MLIYAPYLIGSLRIPYTNAGNNSADGTNLPVFIANESLGGTDVPAGASVQMLFRRLGVTSGAPGTASCTLTGHMYAAP